MQTQDVWTNVENIKEEVKYPGLNKGTKVELIACIPNTPSEYGVIIETFKHEYRIKLNMGDILTWPKSLVKPERSNNLDLL